MFHLLFKLIKLLFKLVALLVGVVLAFVIISNLYIFATTAGDIAKNPEDVKNNPDAALVLGASLDLDGNPTSILADRIDSAVVLYHSGVVDKIIMSGSSTEFYNEPEAMKAYAVEKGIAKEDISLDEEGITTSASIKNLSKFGISDVVICTQDYHLYRSIYLAETNGIVASGYASTHLAYDDQLWYEVREVIARAKEFAVNIFGPVASAIPGLQQYTVR